MKEKERKNMTKKLDQLEAAALKEIASRRAEFAAKAKTKSEFRAAKLEDLDDDEERSPFDSGFGRAAAAGALACFLLVLSGCCTPGLTAAMRAYQDVIGPEYTAYVDADPQLDAEQKANRRNMVEAADAVLREAESD